MQWIKEFRNQINFSPPWTPSQPSSCLPPSFSSFLISSKETLQPLRLVSPLVGQFPLYRGYQIPANNFWTFGDVGNAFLKGWSKSKKQCHCITRLINSPPELRNIPARIRSSIFIHLEGSGSGDGPFASDLGIGQQWAMVPWAIQGQMSPTLEAHEYAQCKCLTGCWCCR